MAFSKESVTLTNNGGGSFTITVGPESYTFDAQDFLSIYNGRRSLDMLFVQIIFQLNAAGVDPSTATFTQIKTAVEAVQYFWGN